MTDALFGSDGTQPTTARQQTEGAAPPVRPPTAPVTAFAVRDDEVPTPPSWPAVQMDDAAEPAADPAPVSVPAPVPRLAPEAPSVLPHLRPTQPPSRPARPPVQEELSLYGLTKRSRTRVGALAFKLIFVTIFLLIAVQTIVVLLTGI